jgi:hypothetical protein
VCLGRSLCMGCCVSSLDARKLWPAWSDAQILMQKLYVATGPVDHTTPAAAVATAAVRDGG